MDNVAEKFATDAGLKLTEMVQLELAAKDAPHVLVWLKALGFVPAIVMPLIVSVAFPVLVRVAA
jgi:hypothetical protein